MEFKELFKKCPVHFVSENIFICAFFCPVPEVLATISQLCEILFWTALFPPSSLELCDGEDGDEKELEKYLLVNCSEVEFVYAISAGGSVKFLSAV